MAQRNRRLMYGFLHREGLRRGDAEHLRWRQIDFEFGTLRIEDDKTRSSRMFVMNPGVVAALRAWKTLKETASYEEARRQVLRRVWGEALASRVWPA